MRRRSDVQPGVPKADVIRIPHDAFNEQVLIAALLRLDQPGRAKLLARVRPELFVADLHVATWSAAIELERKGVEVTPDTIRQHVGAAVDADYLRSLLGQHPGIPGELEHHVSMLEWDRARVDAVNGPISALLAALRDPAARPERVRALAGQVATSFEGRGDRSYVYDPEQLVRHQTAEMRARREQTCWPYGIDGLDRDEHGRWRIVPGAAPKQLTVLTGLSGAGKSTVLALIVLGFIFQRRRVLYGAWEMTGGVTLELLATISLGWSRYKVLTGQLTDEEFDAHAQRMAELSAWVRFWRRPPRAKWNEEALDQIQANVADSACEVAVFDLWRKAIPRHEPDEEERALGRQQDIACATNTHHILVQQQRLKDVELRSDKRPTREGIKGSGAWVEVADTILGVHNPALWKRVDATTIEIDVLKQRYGRWPIAIEFDWDGDVCALSKSRTVEYDSPAAMLDIGGADPIANYARQGRRRPS